MARILAIMGSGETAPTMVKPHRAIFDRLDSGDGVAAVLLDTPYGFQANASDISERAVEYFAASVGRGVEVAGLRRLQGADVVEREAALAKLARARWIFSGPGSPTYALRQWAGTEVPALLASKLREEGCVVFASAAALTLGRYTVPVYEIYKVGLDPIWADGLDLLGGGEVGGIMGGALGFADVAVIPHYNNAEGGNHDTRFCYLGEERLALLESQMSADGWVLGVDEHTALVIDLETRSCSVVGNGVVTVRRQGLSAVVPSGEALGVEDLIGLATGQKARAAGAGPAGPGVAAEVAVADAPRTALHGEIRGLETEFNEAMAARDVEGAVRAALSLEETLFAWAGDTTQSDAGERGRALLRRMIVELGGLARVGARDPREVIAPLVEALLAERDRARAGKRFGDADRIRALLLKEGLEVRDSPEGTSWHLA